MDCIGDRSVPFLLVGYFELSGGANMGSRIDNFAVALDFCNLDEASRLETKAKEGSRGIYTNIFVQFKDHLGMTRLRTLTKTFVHAVYPRSLPFPLRKNRKDRNWRGSRIL